MDAIAEEYALCINHKILIIIAFLITFVRIQDSLKSLTNRQVILKILISEDVTTTFCSLTKIVNILFLLQRKIFPFRNLITHHFKVGKLVDEILEFSILSFLIAWSTSC